VFVIAGCARLLALLGLAACAEPKLPNTVMFDNQSGADALVKVVGATRGAVPVFSGSHASLQVAAGDYFILIRYGFPGHYTYSRGQRFSVESTGTTYSEIKITLHKVVNGNYDTKPASQAEFDRH
jgi:hypothetical protein